MRVNGPGGGSRTHTGSDPRQILSLLRLPVPPLREDGIENSMSEGTRKAGQGLLSKRIRVFNTWKAHPIVAAGEASMSKVSRRELLRWSAAACGAAIGGSTVWSVSERSLVLAQAEPRMHFPSAPRERLAVATWPFRAEIE